MERFHRSLVHWTNILGIGDDDKEAPLLNIFSKNIYIRLGNIKPKEVMLPKAQGGGQHNFVDAGQQLGKKCRHLKLLISRYEDAAAKQQEERTQQTNENTGTGTPPISSESRTGGSESSIDMSRDLNFSSESRTGGSESSTIDTSRDLNSSMLEENTTIVQLREDRKTEMNERDLVKEVHAVKCLFFGDSVDSGIMTKSLLNGLVKTALPMRNGQQIQENLIRRQCILHFEISWGKIRLCRKKSNGGRIIGGRESTVTRDAAAMANKSAKIQVKEERRAATVEKYSM